MLYSKLCAEILAWLLKEKRIDGNNITVTGKTLGENLERWTHKYGELDFVSQDVIRPFERAIKSSGHIRYVDFSPPPDISCSSYSSRILKGNLAPGGSVAKITGKEGLRFTGKARVFDTEDDFVKAVESKSIKAGEKTVAILRYLGPKGGPGTMLRPLWHAN